MQFKTSPLLDVSIPIIKFLSTLLHLSNSLKNPYTPNNHWGYDWAGNSSSPTTEGVSYYHDPVRDTFRVRTLCDGKVIENTIEK